MHLPWQIGEPMEAGVLAKIRRRAIFDCCKWDPQVGDVSTLAVSPLLLTSTVWNELSGLATKLAAETLAMEAELIRRPELLRHLALPRAFLKTLAASADVLPAAPALRVMRFDFHWTTEGWRISETNCDVPGGFVEASGISALVAEHFPGCSLAGDSSAALAEAILSITGPAANVALVHATAYTDDRQVMVHLAGRLARLGLNPHLVAPDHLNWQAGRPHLPAEWGGSPLDFVFRFFPAEWLPNLARRCAWPYLLGTARVPLCNPATALLAQSKRLPLVWDRLEARHATWQALLPETRDPRDVSWRNSDEWIVKPALGRVGDSVGINGVTNEAEWRQIRSYVRWHGGHWVAQRRFDAVPAMLEGQPAYPCFGVYTLGTRACGIYGRIARRALIDHSAQDIAVLVSEGIPVTHTARGATLETVYESRTVV